MSHHEISVAVKHDREPPEITGEIECRDEYVTPAVDIFETPRELVLLADMPGVESSDLEIELNDKVITVLGKVCDAHDDNGTPLLSEYRVKSFYRAFTITEVVDPSRIGACLADGVLKMVLPKRDKSIPRKIPIDAG